MALPKPDYSEEIVHAIRDMIAGNASPDQQRKGMRFILEDICHIYDSPYVERGSDRDSFVMMGRHQVGVLITATQTSQTLEAARARDIERSKPRPIKRGT